MKTYYINFNPFLYNVPFQFSWKHEKNKAFLMLPESIKTEYWAIMGYFKYKSYI